MRLTLSEFGRSAPRASLYIIGTILTEVLSRALGYLDFRTNRNKHTIWRVSESTKQVMTEDVRPLYSHVSEQVNRRRGGLGNPGRPRGHQRQRKLRRGFFRIRPRPASRRDVQRSSRLGPTVVPARLHVSCRARSALSH